MAENPLRRGLAEDRTIDPCAVVIFGASGDLTKRKLMPGLYNLAVSRSLSGGFAVVGVARREKSNESFRSEMKESISKFSRRKPIDEAVWSDFERGVSYVAGTFEDAATYKRLAKHLDTLDGERGTAQNRLFYLAVPPSEFGTIATRLREAKLVRPATRGGGPWTRMVIEKPFGHNLASARTLNDTIADVFDESQVFRIDHYLGKETVQNLLVFRFANSLFEPLWNREHVDHVQITVAEEIGVEGRGKFYEATGVARDIVENHVMQLLCLTAMEPPISLSADSVRDEKVKVLRSLRAMAPSQVPENVIRGQYARGFVRGDEVAGYRDEPDVASDSRVETYLAMRVFVDNWRWGGVPFYVRAGKRLARRVTEIAVQFKKVPHGLFRAPDGGITPNVLALRIQPDEGIALRFISKEPGQQTILRDVAMDFRYGAAFGSNTPEAYERLLLDAMRGEATLFTRRDEVEEQWAYIDHVFEAWAREGNAPPPLYAAGSWGPEQADDLLARDGAAVEEAVSPYVDVPPLSVPPGPPTSAILERLERELRELWAPKPGEAPKSRVCLMNLVVAVGSREIADRYMTVVDEVTAALPSRAIVVSLEADEPTIPLKGSVSAACVPGEGGAVCSERIRLDASGSVCARVASAVEALLVPEIPTTLVWLGPVHVDDDVFTSMARSAQRVVLDSEYTSAGSLLELERWSRAEEGRPPLADMAWTRIAPWQDLCARFFDDPRTEHAAGITQVTLQQASESGARLGSEGALLLGWLATRLGWHAGRMGGLLRLRRADGADIHLHVGAVARPAGVAPAAIASVTIESAAAGVPLKGTIERDLASGAEGAGKTLDADVLNWRLEVAGQPALEHRVRLRANKGARVLERTLHRPMADPVLVEAARFAEHFFDDGVVVR